MSGIISRKGLVLTKKPSFYAYQQAARNAGYPPPSTIPGDLDHDNDVDNDDWEIMKRDFGKTGTAGWIPADIIQNGKVDLFDYNILVTNFGK